MATHIFKIEASLPVPPLTAGRRFRGRTPGSHPSPSQANEALVEPEELAVGA